jgi:hypothetical protein
MRHGMKQALSIMMFSKPSNLFTVGALAIALLTSLAARATPTLQIQSGSSVVTITDGGMFDANSTAGEVTFIGTVGSWKINVTTGTTAPVQGSAAVPYLDLSSSDTSSSSSGAPADLILRFSDVGFGPSPNSSFAHLIANLRGATAGSIGFSLFADAGNSLFGTSTSLLSIGPVSGTFNNFANTDAYNGTDYSMTMVVDVSHPGGSGLTSSFDANMQAIPPSDQTVPDTGTTISLLGLSLLGLVAFGYYYKPATKA